MKTLKIEGFTVTTDLDEQDVFQRLCRIDYIEPDDEKAVINEIERELYGLQLVEFIEEVAINGTPVSTYFYEHSHGYKNRSLEPYNFRATKSTITMSYTGARGGEPWFAKVQIN